MLAKLNTYSRTRFLKRAANSPNIQTKVINNRMTKLAHTWFLVPGDWILLVVSEQNRRQIQMKIPRQTDAKKPTKPTKVT